MSQLVCFKKTSDNWCGNFDRNYVEVSAWWLPVTPEGESIFRVAVWGDDDLGMDKDFSSAEEGMELFHTILALEDVTISSMEELGMGRF